MLLFVTYVTPTLVGFSHLHLPVETGVTVTPTLVGFITTQIYYKPYHQHPSNQLSKGC